MDFSSLLLFVVACLAINMIPGPDVIYIVSNTMKGKLVTGFKAAMGLGVGYFVHTLAASLGLSAIILSSAVAFSAVKWLGAAYLVYRLLEVFTVCSFVISHFNKLVYRESQRPCGSNLFR